MLGGVQGPARFDRGAFSLRRRISPPAVITSISMPYTFPALRRLYGGQYPSTRPRANIGISDRLGNRMLEPARARLMASVDPLPLSCRPRSGIRQG